MKSSWEISRVLWASPKRWCVCPPTWSCILFITAFNFLFLNTGKHLNRSKVELISPTPLFCLFAALKEKKKPKGITTSLNRVEKYQFSVKEILIRDWSNVRLTVSPPAITQESVFSAKYLSGYSYDLYP